MSLDELIEQTEKRLEYYQHKHRELITAAERYRTRIPEAERTLKNLRQQKSAQLGTHEKSNH